MESEENYYDHYKDSFEQQKNYILKRDRYTIALLAMVSVLCLRVVDIEEVNKNILKIITQYVENINLNIKYIGVAISYIFLWLIIQYYQVCLTIEKNYNYIHRIEEKLSADGKYKIEREGINYLKSYPWLKSLTHRIYVFVFPVFFISIAFVCAKIECTYLVKNGANFPSIISLIAYSINILMSILYLSNRWCHEEVFSRKAYPDIKWWKRILFYLGIKKLP